MSLCAARCVQTVALIAQPLSRCRAVAVKEWPTYEQNLLASFRTRLVNSPSAGKAWNCAASVGIWSRCVSLLYCTTRPTSAAIFARAQHSKNGDGRHSVEDDFEDEDYPDLPRFARRRGSTSATNNRQPKNRSKTRRGDSDSFGSGKRPDGSSETVSEEWEPFTTEISSGTANFSGSHSTLKQMETLEELKTVVTLRIFHKEVVAQVYQALRYVSFKVKLSPRTRQEAKEIFEIMSGQLIKNIHHMEPFHICNVLNAHARWKVIPDSLVRDALYRRTETTIGHFKAVNVSSAMWAFASLSLHPPSPITEALIQRAAQIGPSFQAQNVSNTMWAFAKLDIQPSNDLVAALSRQIVRIPHEFRDQHISNIMWAFAMLKKQPGDQVVEALSQQIVRNSGDFSEQSISNVMFAFATLKLQPRDDVVDVLSRRLVVISKGLTRPQANASTASPSDIAPFRCSKTVV